MLAANHVVGEESIFRGILLPKMNGVFGKWDFIANNVLFSIYHLHKIAIWPELLVVDWIYPWATKRFKSYWMAVIIHGSEGPNSHRSFPHGNYGIAAEPRCRQSL